MIGKGGLRYMDEDDSRGLLLLISGFEIPDRVFTNEDIWDLLSASNAKEISSTLRCSIILIPKIPEVINWMVKNNLEVEAADIAYTFGLEDKFHPQTIQKTFLNKKNEDIHNGSSYRMKAAETDTLKRVEEINDGLKNPEEIDETSKKPEEIDDISKKPEEIDDISRNPEATDALKKPN